MKTGLVLEGGAMRGMFTAGVLDFFMDKKIHFDGIIGVSAGALFGLNFLSEQKGRALRYSKRFNSDKNYMGFESLLKTGNLVNTEFAYHKVPRELDIFDDEEYMKSTVPFYAVVTNMNTGEAEYIQIKSCFEQMDVLRASASMPFVSTPVKIGEEFYLDGGVSDSIPYEKFIEMGYDKIIVVLTRDLSYVKKPMPTLPINLFYGKYPAFKERLKQRHQNYNDSVKRLKALEKEGRAFIIRPTEPIELERMEKNPEKLQEVYDLGRKDAEEILDKLLEYMNI